VETLFDELKRYVDFNEADERALRRLHPLAQPHFPRIAEVFYDRILHHEEARKALEGGEGKVGRLKTTLVAWMELLLQGPWDEEYYEIRARIGRVHVRIALPQHYMFGAMNVLHRELNQVVDEHYLGQAAELAATRGALSKILDLELAIMLHTYRLDLLEQQARVERLSMFGELVGSIGHELRNPLGVMESSLYILRGRAGGDERALKHVDRIGEQIALANGIISSLLDIIRDRPLTREPVSLAKVLENVRSNLTLPEGVVLRMEGMEDLPEVHADAGQLGQVFFNLVQNAVQAASPRGEVRVFGSRVPSGVAVAVEDTGPGVAPEIRKRLFEPLVTTRSKGIGLGLALVKRVAERHGGVITYEPAPGAGARFVLRLPTGA
jgi:two-component system, NtrC family, sensor histidine kinase HydH